MLKRVEFPDGSFAYWREKVNVRGRKLLERTSVPALKAIRRMRHARLAQGIGDDVEQTAQETASYTEAEIEALQRFEMAGVAAMLSHWTKEEPIPRTIDEVEDLDPDDYELLATELRPELWGLLGRPKVSPDDVLDDKGKPDLDSPTGPLPASNDGEPGAAATPQTSPPSETVTEKSLTATESSSSEVATPA
jgi:hypothetical protein